MKRFLYLTAACLSLAACTSESLVDQNAGNTSKSGPISFVMSRKNMTRGTQDLQITGHYNFGVFAYKNTDATNEIMANYLVGYNDATNKVGYYMSTGNQTTLGDATGEYNGLSQWAYEMLGSAEYDYTGSEGYYTKDQTQYMSNVANQYLRYWDLSSATTTFYAYAPYINGGGTATYANSTKTLTIPNGSIVAQMVDGTDTPEACEYMIAATEVAKANYGKDVPLNFKRINSKVNIKFWEDIPGYSVKILNLTPTYGVSAAPAKEVTGADNAKGEYFKSSGIVADFSTVSTPTITWSTSATTTDAALNFKSPTEIAIGTTRFEASASPSTYYAIPKDATSGFTFHVSYELTSTTGERITVQNATVFVPGNKCNWAANNHYTYIFKITKGSNGTTDTPSGTIDPNDPKVDDENALYPIVFDNCTVEEWVENSSDHEITNGTDTRDYSVVLSGTGLAYNAQTARKEIKAATGGTINVQLYEDNNDITSGKTFTLTYPTGADQSLVTLSGSTVTVAANAKAGVYTVSWTNTNTNHSPATTYSANFYVIGNYGVSTSSAHIGTNGLANTNLQASTTKDGAAETTPEGTFSIVYPAGCPADKMNQVTVATNGLITVGTSAYVGAYQVAYTTGEGTCYANFTVADYGFSLSANNVDLSTADQNVTIASAGALPTSGYATAPTSVYAVSGPDATNVTIDSSTGTVTVKPAATTGTYTVTRTVTIDGSATSYTKTFTVKDVYTLALDQTVVDNDNSPVIQVTATKNGSTNIANVTVTNNSDVDVSTLSGISYDTTTGKITIDNTCPTGIYKVKNGDKTVTFEVKD